MTDNLVPDEYLFVINQIFEIEKKIEKISESNTVHRNIKRLKDFLANGMLDKGIGLTYYNPLGEDFPPSRTDCIASVAGDSTQNLHIVEVIKPIIRLRKDGTSKIIQKGLVIVEANK